MGIAGGELRQVIEEQLKDAPGSPKFLFDFADVSRMDSSGLGTLIGLHVSVARQGGRIGVINVSNNINNLLVIGRLITIFEHFDSENDAHRWATKIASTPTAQRDCGLCMAQTISYLSKAVHTKRLR